MEVHALQNAYAAEVKFTGDILMVIIRSKFCEIVSYA